MADTSYQPKVYRKQGGDTFVVASGGQILVEPGGSVMSGNPTGASDYFVDGNVSATGSGSINDPYLTLAEAIAASNTSIGLTANRWWARRNRIFVMGDQEITEDLTVFPEKCDVIGVGFDVEAMPRITGTHIIATKAYGTRFFNVGWMNSDTDELIKLTTDHMAVEFYGNLFWPNVAGSTHCIRLADDNRAFKMVGCRILEHAGAIGTGIFAEGIKVEGTGQHDMVIRDNFIRATEGIHVVAATGGYNGEILENRIHAVALTINELSDLWYVTNNRLYSDAADGVAGVGGIVCNTSRAAGNKFSYAAGSGINVDYPVVVAIA